MLNTVVQFWKELAITLNVKLLGIKLYSIYLEKLSAYMFNIGIQRAVNKPFRSAGTCMSAGN